MDEYVDFVETSLREVSPARAARQKDLEERILVAFRMECSPLPESAGLQPG
jgi:hypothetical protein